MCGFGNLERQNHTRANRCAEVDLSYLITLVNIFLCLLFIECCLANHLLPSNTIVHVTYFLKKKEMVFGVLLVFTFISKLIALFQKCIINKREDTELPPTTLHHSLYMFGKLLNTKSYLCYCSFIISSITTYVCTYRNKSDLYLV